MKPVMIPTTDVNSETAIVTAWRVPDRSPVRAGELVAEVETSKAVLDVESPDAGYLLRGAEEGEQVSLVEPLARVQHARGLVRDRRVERHGRQALLACAPLGGGQQRAGDAAAAEAGVGGEGVDVQGGCRRARSGPSPGPVEVERDGPAPGRGAAQGEPQEGPGAGCRVVHREGGHGARDLVVHDRHPDHICARRVAGLLQRAPQHAQRALAAAGEAVVHVGRAVVEQLGDPREVVRVCFSDLDHGGGILGP